jgi:hypothetical protein
LRVTGGTAEVSIHVRDGVTTFRPIAVFSEGAREIELCFDAPAGFFGDLTED